MGFKYPAIHFMAAMVRSGLSLGHTVTIGRQGFQMSPRVVATLQKLGLLDWDEATLASVLNSGDYCETFLQALGASKVDSIDVSDYEKATIIHDMNTPVRDELKQKFDTVIEFGSIEHVYHAATALQNCMEMVKPGGHLVVITPVNNYFGHGFYQFSSEFFYRSLDSHQGYRVKKMLLREHGRRPPWYHVRDTGPTGHRAIFTNSRRTALYTLAQREAVVPLFTTYPQQSDYSANWNKKPGRVRSKRLRFLPPFLRKLFREKYEPIAFSRVTDLRTLE